MLLNPPISHSHYTRNCTCPDLSLNNNIVSENQYTKYLGITINRHFTWKEHIKNKLNDFSILINNMYWQTLKPEARKQALDVLKLA